MLKRGSLDFVVLKMRQSLIAFALLGASQYMDVLLAQLALWEFQAHHQHPIVDILRSSVESFSKHNSRRSDSRLADEAYKCLRMMVHDGMEAHSDLLLSRKLTKGNQRYNLKLDGPEVKRMRKFLKQTYESFSNDEWEHYVIPRRSLRAKKGERAPLLDTDDWTTMVLSSRKKTGTMSAERKTLELIDVRFIGNVDWMSVLKKKFTSLVKRKWKFVEFLDEEQLRRLDEELPEYVYKEPVVVASNEEKKARVSRKNAKRKRVDETFEYVVL